jgi:hypothetical protein
MGFILHQWPLSLLMWDSKDKWIALLLTICVPCSYFMQLMHGAVGLAMGTIWRWEVQRLNIEASAFIMPPLTKNTYLCICAKDAFVHTVTFFPPITRLETNWIVSILLCSIVSSLFWFLDSCWTHKHCIISNLIGYGSELSNRMTLNIIVLGAPWWEKDNRCSYKSCSVHVGEWGWSMYQYCIWIHVTAIFLLTS